MSPRGRISRKAVEVVAQVPAPDALDRKAAERLEEETLQDRTSTRTLRERYATRVFWYLICYSLAALALVGLQGWRVYGFQLDGYVIGLIVGSTAVSAIGLVGFVVKGLFR
jgi:hypothetical protein